MRQEQQARRDHKASKARWGRKVKSALSAHKVFQASPVLQGLRASKDPQGLKVNKASLAYRVRPDHKALSALRAKRDYKVPSDLLVLKVRQVSRA